MNLIKGMLFSAVSLVAALGLQAATYYPVTIIYDPGENKSIANFPVLVRIPVDSPIYAAAGTNGENLRFTDSLGVNNYPHEVDTWNASGESLVWVKIPELKKNFEFRLYCEGSATTAAKDVWSDYAGVWHMNAAVDSADKDYDPAAAEPTHTTKFVDSGHAVNDAKIGIGYGQSEPDNGPAFVSKVYDDRNGYKCPIQVSNRSKFTVSCWARVVDSDTNWTQLFGPTSGRNGQTGWRAEFTGVSKGAGIRMCQRGGEGPELVSFNNPAFDGWTKVDAIWNESSCALYINGALIGQEDVPAQTNPTWYWTGWMAWGGYSGADGVISTDDSAGIEFDECRIYDGVKTADRIAADYQTVNDGDFLTIGPATEEQDIPSGTVAQVGVAYYQDFAAAVAASKATGDYISLMANDQSWRFTVENESIDIKLHGMSFTPINGLSADDYYLDVVLDHLTDVTTFALKKQVKLAAMRNVAVFKILETQDLYDLLPKTVKGLAADGSLAPGDYDVEWDVEKVSKYGSFGISTVSGLATVGGMKLPVKAYVRAALSYSDGYHNIAQEASNMTVIAPGKDGHEEITDVDKIMSGGNPAMITNGLPAATVSGSWVHDPTSSFVNHQSAEAGNPFLDVSFTWPEVKNVHRVEVICQGGDNETPLKAIELYSDGVLLTPTSTKENDSSRPKIEDTFNRCLDFATPVSIGDLKVSMEQPEKAKKSTPRINIAEILVWADGGPIDMAEQSTSAELVKLSFDGRPVGLTSGVYKYTVPHAAEVTAFAGEANVAVTVLPELNKIIRIVTLGEDGSSKIYTIRTGTGFNVILR